MNRRLHILLSVLICGGILLASSCKPKKSALSPAAVQQGEISFDEYFIDANTHFNNNNYEMALKLYNRCIDLKPNEASVYYQISRIYNTENSIEKSLQFALKANQLDASNPYYAMWYARLLRHVNNTSEAVNVLETCRKLNPKDEFLVKDLDAVYALQSATDKRITIWKELIDAKGFKLNYNLKLIELYKQKKDFNSAHLQYDEIKKAAPGKAQYYIEDGNLYLENGDKTNAFINFEKALSINPNNWQLNQSLYKHYTSEKNSNLAVKYLSAGMKDPYTRFETKAVLAAEINKNLLSDSSLQKHALICADAFFELYPDNANALNTAASFYEINKQYINADFGYSRCINLMPNTYDAWLGAIRCHQSIYGAQKTLLLIDSALEYFPNTASLYTMGATNAAAIKNWNSVSNYASSGLSFALLNTDIQNLTYYKAKAEFHKNDFKTAMQTLNSGNFNDDSDGRYFDLLGDIYFKLNQIEQALIQWKKALAKGAVNNLLTKKISDSKYYE